MPSVAVLLVAAATIPSSTTSAHPCNAPFQHFKGSVVAAYQDLVVTAPEKRRLDHFQRRLCHPLAGRAYRRYWYRRTHPALTSVRYSGRVSVDDGIHVAGFFTPRCIALRRNVRNEHFLLTVNTGDGVPHRTIVEQCDWGPASWTGRAIDIHTPALRAMRIYFQPTDYSGSATLLRGG